MYYYFVNGSKNTSKGILGRRPLGYYYRGRRRGGAKYDSLAYPVLVQFNSSEKSLQSLSLSHNQVLGMHRPLAHSNWSTLQFTAKPEMT